MNNIYGNLACHFKKIFSNLQKENEVLREMFWVLWGLFSGFMPITRKNGK